MFEELLFSINNKNDWYDSVQQMDKQTENGLREMIIKMIKEEPLPPQKKNSNLINNFIDYYESLIYFKDWIVKYETEIFKILETKN